MFRQFRSPSVRISSHTIILCLLAGALLGGCSSRRRGGWFKKRMTSGDWLAMALEAENADDRRAGVRGLAKSRDATTDWAVKVFDTVARTDGDAMVRCAAVRALLPSAGPDRVETLLKLLNSGEGPVEGVRRAPGVVRLTAAKLLWFMAADQTYDASQRDMIVQTLLDRLAKDDDRSVRLVVIDTLACFPHRPIPTALIGAVGEDDFAVKRAAERALVTLTGTTHRYDAVAWREWLAAADDPFKDAGAISPEVLDVEKKRWWQWGWEW